MPLECVIRAPSAPHTHTVILLHGRGSNAEDFSEELLDSPLSSGVTLAASLPTVRWVLPTCSLRMSTVFQEEMTEWFDTYSLSDPELRQDMQVAGLTDGMREIHAIIDRELQSVPPTKLFLSGISQGCATAVHALLAQRRRLAGFVGICSWLPFAGKVQAVAESDKGVDAGLKDFYATEFNVVRDEADDKQDGAGYEALKTPAWMCHGTDDATIDVELGRRLRDVVSKLGMKVAWVEFDECGHWIKEPEGIDALAEFLTRQMSASK